MDEYQREFVRERLKEVPDMRYQTACEVATVIHNEYPVVIEEYLNDLCVNLKPIDIVRQFYELNPDEWEYMIFRDTYWEGMNKPDVDAWARKMLSCNLEYCKTSDIDIWDEEKFHEFMWERYCFYDHSFMRNYYFNYDVYPYNGNIISKISQFEVRWGVYVKNNEKIAYDEDLDNGNCIYRIEFDNNYYGFPKGTAHVSHSNKGASLCTEDAFCALPKRDPGTYKEWCARKYLDLNTKSYTLYKREVNLWKLVLTLFPEEKARKELAIVFS